MKVPLRVRTRFGQPMLFFFISIRAPKYHIRPAPVEVLVDTGSPWVAIAPKDSARLNIPIKALERASEHPRIAFAGYSFWRYLMRDVTLHFRDEEENIIAMDLPSISVLTPIVKAPPSEIKHIPSVLGNDFLGVGSFSLRFDPSKNIAFLEKDPS